MNQRMIFMLLASGLLFGGIFGFKAFIDGVIADFFDNMEPETQTITASSARLIDWTPRFETVGSFAPVQGAELSLEQGGIVREINFENGQPVAAGQRLIALDTRVDEAELAQMQASLRLAELELERQQRLYAQRSVSRAVLDRAETEVAQARAVVAAQQAVIDQKILRAPFAGRVGIRQVNPGQYLAPGAAVVSLQALDPIFLNFSAPQRMLPKLEQGAPVQARVDAFPGQVFHGRITALEPRVDESSRSLRIQARFDNADERLRPGMFAELLLDLGASAEVLVVPQTGIRFATYGNSVFTIEDSEDGQTVLRRFVQTGRTRGDLIEILDGLEAGSLIASSGLLRLQNNTPVRIDDDPDVQPSEDPDPRPANR